MTFELHTQIFDSYGDMEQVNHRFLVDRKNCTVSLMDFDDNGLEQVVTLNNERMRKLLKWVVHTLEIFMWSQDYPLAPFCTDPYIGLIVNNNRGDDFDMGASINGISLPPKPRDEPFWLVLIEYSNHTSQDIYCYNENLPDRAEELYCCLLDFFFSDGDFE